MSYSDKETILDLKTLRIRVDALIYMAENSDRPVLMDEIATINEYSEYLGTLTKQPKRAATISKTQSIKQSVIPKV